MPPTGGPEGTLAGVAREVGRNRDNLPQEASEAFADAVLQAGGRVT
jgi:hypothetical protein